jgi:hypothetical protein
MIGGHGHVYPRPDGARARCGGPGICPECGLEFARKHAADLRAQKASSTDPDRLEREVQIAEVGRRVEGFKYLCAMPGEGRWSQTVFREHIIAACAEHGAFRLILDVSDEGVSARWEEIKPTFSEDDGKEEK